MMTAPGVAERAVQEEEEGQDLSRFLTGFEGVRSRNHGRKVLESGKVFVDGVSVGGEAGGRKLMVGQVVRVEWNRPGTSQARAMATSRIRAGGIEPLYEDNGLIALNKPAGLLTDAATRQQDRERDTARKQVTQYLKVQGKRPTVVHRIDRDTSGVVLFAKEKAAADRMFEAFRKREAERIYWVIVEGGPEEDEGLWEDWVVWDGKRNVLLRAHPNQRDRKEAKASFRVLKRTPMACILEVTLDTGKRNQIRFQCQERGYPLVGERLYTPPLFESRLPPCPRQALHAWKLSVPHPKKAGRIQMEAPVPKDLVDWWSRATGTSWR